MEFTFKNIEILNIMEWTRQLMQYKLPVKVGWNLSRNMEQIERVYKSFSEFEKSLVEKYAIKDSSGIIKLEENGQPKFAPINKDKFITERNELFSCESQIKLLKIKLSDLENYEIQSSLLFDLRFIIEDDSDEEN
jgi:hypothetical protein